MFYDFSRAVGAALVLVFLMLLVFFKLEFKDDMHLSVNGHNLRIIEH